MFTEEEKDMIVTALHMRRNFIQTSTVNLGSNDLVHLNVDTIKSLGAEIKVLSDPQMALCLKTTELIDKILRA